MFAMSNFSCARVTLALFRTRRRDECSSLKEGMRRRVRKSRQKEAAGAADAGLMQIEWSEAEGCRSSRGSSRMMEEGAAHLCKDKSKAKVSLGGEQEKGCLVVMEAHFGETL